jgi:hypothetical protein
MTKLKFTDDIAPLGRVKAALKKINDNIGGNVVFEIDGVQLKIVHEDTSEDSYGDSIEVIIVDTPIGLFKVTYANSSYGTDRRSEGNIDDIVPVKLVNTPTYEYDHAAR